MASWLGADGSSEGTDLTASSLQGLTKQLNRRKRKRSQSGSVEVDGAVDLVSAAGESAEDDGDDDDDAGSEINWEAGGDAGAGAAWEDTVLPVSPARKPRRQHGNEDSDFVDLVDDDEDDEPASSCFALPPGEIVHSREYRAQPPGKCIFVAHAGRCTSSDEFQRFRAKIRTHPSYENADHHICAFRYYKLDLQGTRKKSRGKDVLIESSKDDGEPGAGAKLLGILKDLNAIGVAVIVSRWYGGKNLGKDRFKCIISAACSVLAQAGFTPSSSASTGGSLNRQSNHVSEVKLAQGMLGALLSHAILRHAEAMVPSRQDGILDALKEAPQFVELLSDLTPHRVTIKALSKLVVNFNSFTTRGLPHFWTAYGIVDTAAGFKQWGAGLSRRSAKGVAEDAMLTAWRTNRSTPNQCAILFVALCRALSVSVRLVVGLDPLGAATPVGSTPQRTSGGSRGGGASAALNAGDLMRRLAKSNEASARLSGAASSTGGHIALTVQTPMWAEVMATDGSEERWVAVDPVHSKCDCPEQLIEMWYGSNGEGDFAKGNKGKGKGPAYVVAVACCPMLRVTEVSKRYLRDWFNVVGGKMRVEEEWWTGTLSQVSCAATADVEAMEKLDSSRMDDAAIVNASKRVPNTLKDMKRHPVYCMAKQLKQTQIIKPGSRVYGLLDGQPVYRREAIQDLKTEQAWLREARQIKKGERPHRQRAARVTTGGRKQAEQGNDDTNAGIAAAADRGEKEDLYGTWQTEEYVPPAARNGEIPTNEHGNVYLWGGNLKLLPGGCRYVDLPYIQKTCNELTPPVIHKEAFLGFETKDKMTRPKIQGIVVLADDYDRLIAAHTAMTAVTTAKKREKRDAHLLNRWGELIKLVVQMRRVQQNYGSGPQASGASGAG